MTLLHGHYRPFQASAISGQSPCGRCHISRRQVIYPILRCNLHQTVCDIKTRRQKCGGLAGQAGCSNTTSWGHSGGYEGRAGSSIRDQLSPLQIPEQLFWSPIVSPKASTKVLRDICEVGLKSQKDRPPFLDVPSIYVNGN